MTWLAKRCRSKRGQSLVEFAILLPFVVLLVMGLIDFGRMYYTYVSLQAAAREGARYGITGASDQQITDRVESIAPVLNSNYLAVDIEPAAGSRTPGTLLTVTLDYSFHMLTPVIAQITGQVVDLQAKLSMRME